MEPQVSEQPHSKWHDMAIKNTILRAVTGSTAHGINLEGTEGAFCTVCGASIPPRLGEGTCKDGLCVPSHVELSDRDELGVCIESLEAFAGFSEFEQLIYRSAAKREGKHDAPSAPGDLDLTIYGLKKFLRLAMQGNPSVLNLLYVRECVHKDALGSQLQELAPLIVSRQAGKRYLGYMEAQRQRLLGERGQKKTNRPELEEKYGYDTKYAGHILRLGFQGVELLSTGHISLPLPSGPREEIVAVRRGERDLNFVLEWAGQLERELKDLIDTSELQPEPDRARVEKWMIERYWEWWKAQRVLTNDLTLGR